MQSWTSIVVAGLLLVSQAFAQDKPMGQVPGELFFTVKNKQPFGLERVYPGVTAALMLTDEQKLALYQSLDSTIRADDLRKALEGVKSNPNATAEDKMKAARLMADARDQLREAIRKVLKPEQQKTVESIQAAFDESQKAVFEAMQPEFSAAKGDVDKAQQVRQQWQERVKEDLARRLDKILTAEQQDAVKKAAAEQKAREQEARENPKK